MDGGHDLQIWKVAANILSKQSQTADKEWPSSLEVRRGANKSQLKEFVCYEVSQRVSDLDGFFGQTTYAKENEHEI
jgi:hypothetical protein